MNRAQRRFQKRENRKTEITEQQRNFNDKLHTYYQRQLNDLVEKYNKELETLEEELQNERKDNIEQDWYWFYSNLCLTLKEDYHKNNDYIAKFITKMENRLRAFKDSDLTRNDLIKLCQEKCDIILCDEDEVQNTDK